PDRTEVLLGGMLSSIKFANTKNGRPGAPTKYANFDLEDVEGMVRCILWPDDFVTFGSLVQPEAILVLKGVVDRRGGGDEVNLVVNELIPLDQLSGRYTTGIVVRLDESQGADRKLMQVREIVRGYPGNCELQLLLKLCDDTLVHLRSQRIRLEVCAELSGRLDEVLGPGNVRMITARPTGNGGSQGGGHRRGRRPGGGSSA
ncbi:MAG: OB-fold nucleic acid binding domain-containing protein, partial [Pirellulaceae bacterium]